MQPVFERLDTEKQRQRDGDGPELVDRHMRDNRLETLRQKERHTVAARNPAGLQGSGKGVGAFGQFAIGQAVGLALRAIVE
jgi:hypothetical protein